MSPTSDRHNLENPNPQNVPEPGGLPPSEEKDMESKRRAIRTYLENPTEENLTTMHIVLEG